MKNGELDILLGIMQDGAPPVISWFISPMNYRYITNKNHSEIGVMCTNAIVAGGTTLKGLKCKNTITINTSGRQSEKSRLPQLHSEALTSGIWTSALQVGRLTQGDPETPIPSDSRLGHRVVNTAWHSRS